MLKSVTRCVYIPSTNVVFRALICWFRVWNGSIKKNYITPPSYDSKALDDCVCGWKELIITILLWLIMFQSVWNERRRFAFQIRRHRKYVLSQDSPVSVSGAWIWPEPSAIIYTTAAVIWSLSNPQCVPRPTVWAGRWEKKEPPAEKCKVCSWITVPVSDSVVNWTVETWRAAENLWR
jgi:hypothetical protein